MGSLFRYGLAVVLNIALPLLLQIADKRWLLNERQRSGAWNTASWGAAVYGFGPASMIGWVWVTRQEWRQWRAQGAAVAFAWTLAMLGAGLLAAAGVLAVVVGVDWVVAWGLGLEP